MNVGYMRVSTVEQVAGYEHQRKQLLDAGAEKLFEEKVSSVTKRSQLEAALTFVRKGDTLIVTKLDRLARSVPDLLRITNHLQQKECGLRILDMNIDTSTPTGRLLLMLIGAISEFERSILLERQKVGIEKAKAEGRYKGRPPSATKKVPEMKRLAKDGMSYAAIAKHLGVSRTSVYRLLK